MAKKRKTIEVEKVRTWANTALASDNLSQAEKKGVAGLLEVVLHDTGNYKGFNNLPGVVTFYDDGRNPTHDPDRDYDRKYH